MHCPKCNKDNDKVIESRPNKDGTAIRRRRECLECGYRFTSYERVENRPIIVIKKDGSRQAFDIGKIERGIERCTEKLNIPQERIDETLRAIEDNVAAVSGSRNTITSREVGEETLRQLYALSPVAYVRFASVYRRFDNLEQFIKEIESLAKRD